MEKKLNFTPETILNIKFSPKEKGYDPLEVDKLFDSIIEDYKSFLGNEKELENANAKQLVEINNLKEELARKEFDVATLKKQLQSLPSANGINEDNYKLLKKISAYERILHRKGINPEKALSDPDNC